MAVKKSKYPPDIEESVIRKVWKFTEVNPLQRGRPKKSANESRDEKRALVVEQIATDLAVSGRFVILPKKAKDEA